MDAKLMMLLGFVMTLAHATDAKDEYLEPKKCIMRLAQLFSSYDLPPSVYEYAERMRRAKKVFPYSGDNGPTLLDKTDCRMHRDRFDAIIADKRAACFTDFTNPLLTMVNEYFHALLVQESEAVKGAPLVARYIIGARGCATYMA